MASGNVVPFIETYYPPDTNCTLLEWRYPELSQEMNCSVTDGMVGFLNLTGPNITQYLAAYCLNPPGDDSCLYGFCPNPDIAGPLVRIANYITGLCLAILIFYSPRRVKAAFWSQALITYSLLITCGISLVQGNLTRYHAIILISIVCSPVNFYFLCYSIRAFWGSHQLDAVLGKRQYVRRAMVFFAVSIWTSILVYAYLPQRYTKFSQDSCRWYSAAEEFFLGAPFVWAYSLVYFGGRVTLFLFLLIPTFIIAAWAVAIIRRRKEIWPPGESWRPRFGKVWRTIMKNYPFLRFWSVVAVPTAYWVGIIEVGVLNSQDVTFSLTFGQVLALFTAVPPIIQVFHLVPDLWRWFINLPLVRFITRRPAPEVPSPEEMGILSAGFIDRQNKEKDATFGSQSSSTIEQPRLGRIEQPDRSDGLTEYG